MVLITTTFGLGVGADLMTADKGGESSVKVRVRLGSRAVWVSWVSCGPNTQKPPMALHWRHTLLPLSFSDSATGPSMYQNPKACRSNNI
eukprot:6872358-Pyramimonas_sp.AAC.1